MNQDFTAWLGQEVQARREQEHLGESDRGVIMMRRRLVDDIKVVADGGEPKGLVRDEALNRCVPLPIIGRSEFIDGTPPGVTFGPGQTVTAEGDFVFLAGQPDEIRLAYCDAMGILPRSSG
jgi:5,5'-dehydrodivanillate O-demethylase